MNSTYKSCDKFIRNQLFSSFDEQENQYDCKTRRFEQEQNNDDCPNSKQQYQNQKIQRPFNQRSNVIDFSQKVKESKDSLQKPACQKKVTMKSSFCEDNQSSKNQTESFNKQTLFRSDVKPKKKSTHRKNNLKQLFMDIEDNVEQDCPKENQQSHNTSNSSETNQKQFYEPKNFYVESQRNKKQSDELSQMKESSSKFLQTENGNSPRLQEISQQGLEYLKANKFNFLHNELDFDSSSDEQQEHMESSVKKSESSENDFDKVAFQMPSIRSKKNIFIKSSDLDFDSSDQQENAQNRDEQEHSNDFEKEKEKKNIGHSQSSASSKSSKNITVTDFRRDYISHSQEYLKKSLPSNTSIDFIVKRDKSKNQYYIYDSKTLKLIVVIAKKSSTYEIYAKTNVENPRAHPDLKYLTAKIETNFLGTEFNLKYIQHEFSHSKTSQKDQAAATICYQTNFLGFNGPRKMNVYIPQNSEVKYHDGKSLESLYNKNCGHRVDKYVNKQAKWNEQVKSYVLNMKGKAKLSSVKNFVIVKDTQDGQFKDKSFVIFGKNSKDIFNLSITGPFSILQGISIGLSSFQRKITCE